ncbi:hypothetical protein GWA97_06440 [Flavobacterium sp. LaA7.5]|nr:hypothetical protein [Flavobacterium salilacus subsp. altitudinum]
MKQRFNNMGKDKSLNKIIPESTIIISSSLIFFGFLKQYWFFSTFRIKIQNYLSIDEVIIIFLGELPFLLKLILWAILYIVLFKGVAKVIFYIKDKKNSNNTLNSSEEEFENRFEEGLKKKKNLIILLVMSLLTGITGWYIFISTYSEIALIYLVLQLCQGIYVLIDLIDIDIEAYFRNIIVFVFGLSTVLYCKNIIDIKDVLSSNEVEFISKTGLNIDSKFILIGKTKDFIFLYNKFNQETRILKAEDFVELKVKK